MRWKDEGRSSDVEDRRGAGGLGGLPIGGAHIGVGGFILLLVLSFVFKRNFLSLVGTDTSSPIEASRPVDDPREEPEVRFVSFVFDDAQRTWEQLLAGKGVQYRHAKLVLFRDATQSGCSFAQSATGPFYCPEDEKVYIDLSFYEELKQRFGAPGEFAQAYVLAHEIGHHVQKILGIEQKVQRAMGADPRQANAMSVRLELQADCLAGVWGHSTSERNLLEQGDVESGLRAAAAVGDYRLQKMSTGHVTPDSFTHGSSEQRSHWFQLGLNSGNIQDCNTFAQ